MIAIERIRAAGARSVLASFGRDGERCWSLTAVRLEPLHGFDVAPEQAHHHEPDTGSRSTDLDRRFFGLRERTSD